MKGNTDMKKLLLFLVAVLLIVPFFGITIRADAETVSKTAEYEKGQETVDLTFDHKLVNLNEEFATEGLRVGMQGSFALENGTNNFDVTIDNERYTVEKLDPQSNVRFFVVKLKDGESYEGGDNEVTATITVHVNLSESTTGIEVDENGNFNAGWKIRELDSENQIVENGDLEYVQFTVTAVTPPEKELEVKPEGSAADKLAVDSETVELSDENFLEALVVITADPAEPKETDAKLAFKVTAQITLKDEDGNTIDAKDVAIKSIELTFDVSEAFKAGDKVTISHYADDGSLKEKKEGVTVDENGKVKYVNTKGFSTFEFSAYTEPEKQQETQTETKTETKSETVQPAKSSSYKVVNTAGK